MSAAKRTAETRKRTKVFTEEERDAMVNRAQEAKAEARRAKGAEGAAEAEAEVLAKIAEMPAPDRAMAERIHAIVKASAPVLSPRTYYGMPAYSLDGKTICFFKPASKFKVRYSTFGFQPDARLDDGDMWPTEFAVTRLTPAVEARIAELVKKTVS
jgi:uncharacterized protein YdhG (YjbR/CyaY superfamily)